MWFFRAVAVDLDGTLAVDDHVSAEVLAAVDNARKDRRMLLVTGRIARDLDRVFPGLADHFDAVVTENGAVLTRTGPRRQTRLLHEPVDLAVDKALADHGVAADRGQVLVGIDGEDAAAAAQVLAELGLDHQVVRNRGRAMILPAGVTKATGLSAALTVLGLSPHNAVAVGDAENDLTLLRAAELGAAVANAVPSLAEHADLVLQQPNGAGVADLLGSPLLAGRDPLWPPRRQIAIGSFDDGSDVQVPGAQASLLITGDSGAGKSYLAGLLAERWMDASYSVLVIDPEGDHTGLAERPDVQLVNGSVDLPNPTTLMGLLRQQPVSVVLDLSAVDGQARRDYLARLPSAIAAERSRRGVPHWVIYDEAHQEALLEQTNPIAAGAGSCRATWRPDLLDAGTIQNTDFVIDLESAVPSTRREPFRATLRVDSTSRQFKVGERGSEHVRHRHKYAAAPLPASSRFYFHDQDPTDVDAAAASLEDFNRHLGQVDVATLSYHASRGDFSRWVGDAMADDTLARELAHIERDLHAKHAGAVEEARQQIRRAIQHRYLCP